MTILRIAEPRGHFRVTFDSVSELSAECGSTQSCGWLDWQGHPVDDYTDSCWDLQDLRDHLADCDSQGDGATVPSFVSFDPGMDWWLDSFWDGIRQSVSDPEDLVGVTAYVHRPSWITDSSWLRVLRLLGWRQR